MIKKFSYIIITLLSVVTLAACSTAEKKQGDGDENTSVATPVAKGLPAFALKDMQGNAVNLQAMNGKKVFVNLWATWCPPCRSEMPSIEKLYASADKDKVAFVMLSLDEDPEASRQFMQANQFSFPVFFPAEQPPGIFNTSGIPVTIIFNENGEIIKQNTGADNYDTEVYRQMLR